MKREEKKTIKISKKEENDKKVKSLIQEHLVSLYLRLNGYFTSGLIVHSSNIGEQITEIDNIAIRFPKHLQEDRKVECSRFLFERDGHHNTSNQENTIDILICEVRSRKINFNPHLYDSKSRETWEKILNWIGLFSEEQIDELIPKIVDMIRNKSKYIGKFLSSDPIKTEFGTVIIRPMIFVIERTKTDKNTVKFVPGSEVLNFIWKCLCPKEERDTCSSYYDYNSWGTELALIVKFFKNHRKKDIPNIKNIYSGLFGEYKIMWDLVRDNKDKPQKVG